MVGFGKHGSRTSSEKNVTQNLDEIYFRWLENIIVLEIGKTMNSFDFQPSKMEPLLEFDQFLTCDFEGTIIKNLKFWFSFVRNNLFLQRCENKSYAVDLLIMNP